MWKKIAAFMVLVTAASLFYPPDVEGRGGGRGGGGGGRGGGGGGGRGGGSRGAGAAKAGGAYRGGKAMNRTPTMSRAKSKPTGSKVGQRPQSRPSISQGRTRPSQGIGKPSQGVGRPSQGMGQSRQTLQQRPSAANRSDMRNQVNRYVQNRPAQNVDRQALAQKAQNFSNKRSNQLVQNRQLSDKVSNRLEQSRPNYKDWFDRDFFDHHDLDVDYAGLGTNWWRPAAWATLAAWGTWRWSTPYYYDEGGYVYPLSADEYAYSYPYDATTTATQTVQTQPAQTTATVSEDWLPLGVFAVASNSNAAAYTNLFIQLALNRNGEIAGVLYNSTTDDAQDLTGMVDTTSQKAYWPMDNRADAPIASTGIYNLTEDQTPINVHFADGSDQTWTLVRLQQ